MRRAASTCSTAEAEKGKLEHFLDFKKTAESLELSSFRMEKLLTEEREKVRHSLHLVRNESWKNSLKPHDCSVKLRSSIPVDCQVFDKEIFDVVNDFHAFCMPCQYHIYSKSEKEDENSLYISHVNSHEHRINLGSLSKWSEIFEKVFEGADEGPGFDDPASFYRFLRGDRDSDELFDIYGARVEMWNCNACGETMPIETKEGTRSLREEVQIHMATSQHKHNEFLIKDKDSSLLVAIALTPVFKYLTSESKCTFCDAKISKYGIDHHIKSDEHLKRLRSLITVKYRLSMDDLRDEGKQLELFKKLVVFETESASSGRTIVPTTMEFSSLTNTEKRKVGQWVKFVENEVWKKWQDYHPSSVSVYDPSEVYYFCFYEKDHVEIFNESHAYCSACQVHIFTGTDLLVDDSCYFISHINSDEHRFNLRRFPKDTDAEIIELLDYSNEGLCNACQKVLPMVAKEGRRDLSQEICDHINTAEHDRNARLMSDEDQSVLVSIAMSPILKCLAEEPVCHLCEVPFSAKFGNESHIKTAKHLAVVGETVEQYNFTTRLLFDVENKKELFAKLVKDC